MAQGGRRPQRSRFAWVDIGLGFAVLGVIAFAIAPIPPWLLDLLLVLSLAMAALTLLAAVWTRRKSALAAFPVILLLCTAFRLAINIASTRMILAEGHAGAVIDAFAGIVIADDLIVGAVIFGVITLAQFLVVTRGAERIAEVAARFSLDALPGEQLAIDAEQRRASISAREAQLRSEALRRDAQFYGAMDGTMRYVRGDAIVGLIITALNLVAGSAFGITRSQLAWDEALRIYGRLSIGDGLASQAPALLLSTAAALIVTRPRLTHSSSSIGTDVLRTLVASPLPMAFLAAGATLLALAPGFPFGPFAVVATLAWTLCLWIWWNASGLPDFTAPQTAEARSIVLSLPKTRLKGLRAKPHQVQSLHAEWRTLSSEVQTEIGIQLPALRLAVDSALAPSSLRLDIAGKSLLLHSAPTATETFAHAMPLLRSTIKANAQNLLSVSATESLIHQLAEQDPALIREVAHSAPSTLGITQVLRGLLEEGVSIRQLSPILESLVQSQRDGVNLEAQVANARVAIGHFLVEPFLDAEGRLPYLQFDAFIETELLRRREESPTEPRLILPPELRLSMVESLRRAQQTHNATLLLVPALIRMPLQRLIRTEMSGLSILSWEEVPPDVPVQLLERLAA